MTKAPDSVVPDAPAESGRPPRVGDVMSREIAVVHDADVLAFASQILLWRGVRHLPVLDADDKLVGILSDRDLLRVVIEGPAGGLPVSQFMSKPVHTVHADTDLGEASSLLWSSGIDALPVLEGDKLVGILTTSDVLAERGRSLRKAGAGAIPRACDVMSRRVLVTHPTDSLASAIRQLLGANIRHVPVVDADLRIVGMLSDRDVRTAVGDPLRAMDEDGGGDSIRDRTVESVMTRGPITVGATASVLDLARIFVDERVGAIPVVRDDDTLIGIVSYVDVIGHFLGRKSAPQSSKGRS